MPRAKGKANYKVEALIQVVEEKLPNGVQGWVEVAALYQHRSSGELVLRDSYDMKQHWIEKCCNKFKKLTGVPGDPKRDRILKCQWIQQRIHAKTSSSIMGVESGGDDGLVMDGSSDEDSLEEKEQKVAAAEVLVGGIGLVTNSRIGTPTNFVDCGGGVFTLATVPPLPHPTQQSTKGFSWQVPH
jgi:hypothetical protein